MAGVVAAGMFQLALAGEPQYLARIVLATLTPAVFKAGGGSGAAEMFNDNSELKGAIGWWRPDGAATSTQRQDGQRGQASR